MEITDQQVAAKFALFEKERDPARIYEALDLVETVTREASSADPAAGMRVLPAWLSFFTHLESQIDPTWDPDNLPVAGVAPPVDQGVVYSSGEVDPASIPDPAARAAYQQALKSGKEAEKRFGIQFQLRRIDERAMRHVANLLARLPDGPQIDKQFAASRVSETRKQQLRAMSERP